MRRTIVSIYWLLVITDDIKIIITSKNPKKILSKAIYPKFLMIQVKPMINNLILNKNC